MNSGVAFSVSSLISGAVRQPWSSPTHRARRMNQHMHQTLTGPAHQQPSSLKTNVHNNPRDTNNLLCILWYVLLCTPLHGYVDGGRVIKKVRPWIASFWGRTTTSQAAHPQISNIIVIIAIVIIITGLLSTE